MIQTNKALMWPGRKPAVALTVATLSVAATCIGIDSASAQDSGLRRGQLEEVVVTARKTQENLQQTPVSVTALSSDDLRNRSITSLSDVQSLTPSLQLTSTANNPMAPFVGIRGRTTAENAPNFDPSIGTYVDGVYVGASPGSLLSTYVDIDRIEVLKGPQGTLYGRNTTGGALNIYTKAPTNEFEAEVNGSFGNYDQYAASAVVNVPLGELIRTRLVTGVNKQGGYGRDVRNDRELGDADTKFVRAAVELTPMEDLRILLRGEYSRGDTNGAVQMPLFLNPGSAAHLELAAERYGGLAGLTPENLAESYAHWQSLANSDGYDTELSYPSSAKTDIEGASATITYDVSDNVALKSTTAYRFLVSKADSNFVPLTSVSLGREEQRFHQFTQEFQLNGKALDDRLTYVAGAFYYEQAATFRQRYYLVPMLIPLLLPPEAAPLFGATPPGIPALPTIEFYGRDNVKSTSGYGQVSYAFVPTVSLTAGVRYTHDKKERETTNFSFGACSSPTCPFGQDKSFSNTSYTIGLDWKATDDLLLYTKLSTGYKSGGFQQRQSLTAPASLDSFDPEKVREYEAGVKAEWFDRRLRTNLAYYHATYKDIQITVVDTSGLTTVVQNAGTAKIDGAEFEGSFVPFDRALLSATVAYTDARYTTYVNQFTGEDLSYRPFVNVPEWTYTLSAGYTLPTSPGDLHAQVDWSWRDDTNLFPAVPQSRLPQTAQRSYGLLNARLGLQIDQWDAEVALFGKNLTDKRYYTGIVDFYDPPTTLGGSLANLALPRTYGVSFTKRL